MSDTPSFSDQMRTRADRTWRAILRHRFFREVATDTINDRIFARYLRIEYEASGFGGLDCKLHF